ncbi:MAG: hypothetical protein AB8G14_11185 [Ilumatobacter sp.]
MAQLILLVVAAAWLAVLIPPMLRSRVENRPNSSVTDFRRQLTKLQNTATPPRGAVRSMGRPLTESPLSRPVAAGRPGQPQLRSGVTRHATASELAAQQRSDAPTRNNLERPDEPRFRSHGDPTGGQRRPAQRQVRARDDRSHGDPTGGQRRQRDTRPYRDEHGHDEARFRDEAPVRTASGRRTHGDPTGGQHRPSNATGEMRTPAKQRRMNIMFVLVVTTACALFLAATTSSDVMLYAFVLSFISLCGYIWMLAQVRQREATGSYDGWMDSY